MSSFLLFFTGIASTYYRAYVLSYINIWFILDYTNLHFSSNFLFIMLYLLSVVFSDNDSIFKASEYSIEDNIFLVIFNIFITSILFLFGFILK